MINTDFYLTLDTLTKQQYRALLWFHKHISFFNPFDSSLPNNDGYKMYAELGLLLFLAYRNKDVIPKANFEVIENINVFYESILTNNRYYEQLQLDPSYFRRNGSSIIFYLTYKDNEILKSIIKRTYKTAYNITPEMQPFRKMDWLHLFLLAKPYIDNEEICEEQLSGLAQNTIIYSDFDLINYNVSDEYSITHILFYLTDFGRIKYSEEKLSNLKNILPTLVYKNIIANDMDLLSEYIINLCNLNIYPELIKYASEILFNNQNQDGSFPAPSRGRRNQAKARQAIKYGVEHNYHATIAGTIATFFLMKQING